MSVQYSGKSAINVHGFLCTGYHGGLEHQIQVLVVKSSECGFESLFMTLVSLSKMLTIIASLHPGV